VIFHLSVSIEPLSNIRLQRESYVIILSQSSPIYIELVTPTYTCASRMHLLSPLLLARVIINHPLTADLACSAHNGSPDTALLTPDEPNRDSMPNLNIFQSPEQSLPRRQEFATIIKSNCNLQRVQAQHQTTRQKTILNYLLSILSSLFKRKMCVQDARAAATPFSARDHQPSAHSGSGLSGICCHVSHIVSPKIAEGTSCVRDARVVHTHFSA